MVSEGQFDAEARKLNSADRIEATRRCGGIVLAMETRCACCRWPMDAPRLFEYVRDLGMDVLLRTAECGRCHYTGRTRNVMGYYIDGSVSEFERGR